MHCWPTALHRPRLFSLKITDKIRWLAASRVLNRSQLIAHPTDTIPGVAAHPSDSAAMQRLARFKQRNAPFLLLADSVSAAMRLPVWLPGSLRREMHAAWPGGVTLVFPARPRYATGLHRSCFAGRRLAVRVDANAGCRFLAGKCGGFIASSSLNRKRQSPQKPDRKLRWRRFIRHVVDDAHAGGFPSEIRLWQNGRIRVLRGADSNAGQSP